MVRHGRHILEYDKKEGFPSTFKKIFPNSPDKSELLYQYKIIVTHDSWLFQRDHLPKPLRFWKDIVLQGTEINFINN